VLMVAVSEQQPEAELAPGVLSRPAGHRVIARRPGRPPGTVRGWLRAARARSDLLRCCATRYACALDPGELARVTPAGSMLADAVEVLAIAFRAWTLRFGCQHSRRELAVWLTGGLLTGMPPPPP
jgi:hypothetical protein